MTPVDNQFILEYLPNATGDAVRVYLYGLMQCYHPQQAMTLEQMARELSLTEETVLTAYRHWERKGLVRRIQDNPPVFRYVSIKQLTMTGGAVPLDQEYEAFAAAVYGLFGNDRRLHGAEMSRCYEWVEELHLPAEAVLYLIREMIAQHGRNVAIKTIEKRAALLAEEGVQSVEDAEAVLTRDKAVWEGSRAVIRRFGKRRSPSEDEMNMYRTWHVEYGFSPADILAACAETTKGEPNFAYLDGIIRRLYNEKKTANVEAVLRREQEDDAPLKALLKVMKLQNLTINEGTRAVYADMRALYPDSIILMAGRECAKRGADFEGVMTTLKNWKHNGLESAADVTGYMRRVDDQNDFLRMLYDTLGVRVRPNAADRRLTQKWQEAYGYDAGFITQCAAWAAGKDKPMVYLDRVLGSLHEQGVTTVEEAVRAHAAHQQSQPAKPDAPALPRVKTVEHQQYTQREYVHSDDAMDAMMKDWEGHADA